MSTHPAPGAYAVRAGTGYAAMPAPRTADPPRLQNLSGRTMGTLWSLRLDNPAFVPLDQVRTQVEAAFERVVMQMSTWESGSDICRFNNAPAGSVHTLAPEFLCVLESAMKWAEASQGAIDPTVGPLVGLWGFGAHARPACWPASLELEAIRSRVNWRNIELDAGAASVRQPGSIELDLSGIAKGFAVDHACAALHELGLRNFVLEVGGDLRACGRRPDGDAWRIQVEAAQDMAEPLALADMAVATSGDRWHAHAVDGQRWSHTIDPRTGRPIEHGLASVSVLHPECMQADAIATLLTVLGHSEGLAFARQHEIAALFVVREPRKTLRRLASPRWPSGASPA